MELLVVSRDRPVPESPGRWHRGDVVVVHPDGWEWGREELNPDKFTIIRLPGNRPDELPRGLIEPEMDTAPMMMGQPPILVARKSEFISDALMRRVERGQSVTLNDVASARRGYGSRN